MQGKSLYNDIRLNPRSTEDSRVVASKWSLQIDPYLPELPDAETNIEDAWKDYLNITAERLIFRMRLLNLPVDDSLASSEAIMSARPFGDDGPTFNELILTSTQIAAAFIPLMPEDVSSANKPVMARLYCVSGLRKNNYRFPFIDGENEPGIRDCSWFIAGVKHDVVQSGISGRSWMLAAKLLMQIIKNRDVPTAKNLAGNFIVTGDVANGSITQVEIGRKPELDKYEFRNFKWIVPMKNANEIITIPSRRIEKPATLEEAYKLIESMQSKATQSFMRFLKNFDLEGMKEQYEIGADIFTEDKESGLVPIEYAKTAFNLMIDSKMGKWEYPNIAHPIQMPDKETLKDPPGGETMRRGDMDRLMWRPLTNVTRIIEWLRGEGADCANMFYCMARERRADAIEIMSQYYPLNARSAEGCTAVDLALNNKDWDTAQFLYDRFGITCDASASRNACLKCACSRIFPDDPENYFTDADFELIRHALEVGMSPMSQILQASSSPELIDYRYRRRKTTLFELAILGGCGRLVRHLLECGVDANVRLQSYREDFGREDEWYSCYKPPTPLEIAYKHRVYTQWPAREEIIKLLKEHGATETMELKEFRRTEYQKALAKVNGKEDGYANHAFIAECIMDGEPFTDRVNGVLEWWDKSISRENSHTVSSSIYGMALEYGWINIVEACLEKGASPNEAITFNSEEDPIKGDVYETVSPMEIAQRSKSEKTRVQLVDLLKKYGEE